MLIVCKKCGKAIGYNSHFGGYYCSSCGNIQQKAENEEAKIIRHGGNNMRRDWYIKPYCKFVIDKEDYAIALLPTIVVQPWQYRYPGLEVIDIHWLVFHVVIGRWTQKEREA